MLRRQNRSRSEFFGGRFQGQSSFTPQAALQSHQPYRFSRQRLDCGAFTTALAPDPKGSVWSIDLVVCADGFQDKGRLALVFRQPKHDAEIVTTAGRPRTRQRTFEFVRAQRWSKRVGFQAMQ